MNKNIFKWFMTLGIFLVPLLVFAGPISGNEFETRMTGLADQLINVVMPLMAILGLVWAGILAVSGNETARGKILLVVTGSIVAILSPHIIMWIKGVLN